MPDSVHPDERERIANRIANGTGWSNDATRVYTVGFTQAEWDVILSTLRPAPVAEGERERLMERVAQLTAHRACLGVEHDPANGKLHGYCVVCGVPWPCEVAALRAPTEREPAEVELQGCQLSADGEWLKFYAGDAHYRFPVSEMRWLLAEPQQAEAEGSEG